VPTGISETSFRRAKAVIDDPKVPIRLAKGQGFTPLMYMLFERGYYNIGKMLFDRAPADFTKENFLEYPESNSYLAEDPEVKKWKEIYVNGGTIDEKGDATEEDEDGESDGNEEMEAD